MIGLPRLIKRTGRHVYHTTGFTKSAILEICAKLREMQPAPKATGRKPALSLFNSVVISLTYLRRNRVQQELAETYDVSQSTISRVIAAMTVLLEHVLHDWVPTADDLDPNQQLIVDGTLLPCWSWSGHRELWSGKHRTTGLTVQVACTLDGVLAWISDPLPGNAHDMKALRESGFLDVDTDIQHLADKGYIGSDMLTPYRKPPGGELLEWQKEYNAAVNRVRAAIERVIANLKTWRILHTDYRRPLHTFTNTISTVIALEFYRESF